MNSALSLFVFLPIVALILIGYQRPPVMKTTDFRFARLMSGFALFFFAVSSLIPSLAKVLEVGTLASWALVPSVCWIFVVIALRGVFEVLARGR